MSQLNLRDVLLAAIICSEIVKAMIDEAEKKNSLFSIEGAELNLLRESVNVIDRDVRPLVTSLMSGRVIMPVSITKN